MSVQREPGVTVSSNGHVKRNGRLLGFVARLDHKSYRSSTTSRVDGSTVSRAHRSREDAIAYVLAHGWAYGDPPKESDERGAP